jgi:hypothetical protein
MDLERAKASGIFLRGDDKKIARIDRLRWFRFPAKRARSIAIARTGHLADANHESRDEGAGEGIGHLASSCISDMFHNDIY